MSCTPRLTIPSFPSAVQRATGARTEELPPTDYELLIADTHLQRLKDRVRKSMSQIKICGWKRTPLSQEQREHPHFIRAAKEYQHMDRAGQPYGLPLPPYHFAFTEPCRADRFIKLDWRVTASDIVRVFRFWNNKSVLSADDGLSAKLIAELQLKAKRSRHEFDGPNSMPRQSHPVANENITLLVWRLRYILESHMGTAYDQNAWCREPAGSSLFHSALNAPKWLNRKSNNQWTNGILQNKPMIITASDILPMTVLEARMFHHTKDAIHRVIHMVLDLNDFGSDMLFHWRKREQEADAKRKQLQAPQLQIDDPLEVTMSSTSDDEDMDSSEAEEEAAARRPVWYRKTHPRYEYSDELMRHYFV